MPEFIHNFTKGKMNKDLDERLVPNGEYRDALNLDLANSDASDVGTMQNIAGNLEIRNKIGAGATWTGGYIDSMTNPVCIGSYRNNINERIYWFIASDGISAIAEYDEVKNAVSPVLVDTAGILNFSIDYLITGINIIDKFLFWTDDQTEPKKINIEKFKIGSTNFATQSKIPKWEPNQDSYNTNLSGRPDFVEADITTIKLSPLDAPTHFMGASASDNPGQAPQPGTGLDPLITSWGYLDLENFTYKPNIIINPIGFESLPTYAQYLDLIDPVTGDPNVFQNSSLNPANSEPYPNGSNTAPYWDGRVTFQVNQTPGSVLQVGEILILSGELVNQFGPNTDYEISLKIHAINGVSITGEIQAISKNINKSLDSEGNIEAIPWEVLLVEKKPLFEYVFPRFAYRWKYIDNEYSCYSPFSSVAFIGNDFEYLSSDGYNVGMTNNLRKLIIQDLVWNADEISEIDILYKESNNTTVYVVDTLKKSEYQNTTLPTEYEIKTELIGAVVESNQLLRPWDNVPREAKSQEIIGNRIVYGNYLQNYDIVGVVNESTGEISTPVKLNTTLFSTEYPDLLITDEGATVSTTLPYASLKSIRTYQAGVVYKDAYGRETPVFTSENSGLQVDIVNSSTVNKLAIQPTNIPPSWATHYKFFVKETSNEYYNLALDRYYLAEDGNVWLSFPSSERNKITEESYLILKKQHDNNVAVKELNRYKILSIDNSAPDFISKFDNFVASRDVVAENEIEPGRITIEFGTGSDPGATFRGGLNSSANKLTITYQGITSNKYDISGSTPSEDNTSFDVVLSQPLGNEVPNIDNGSDLTITIYEEVTKKLPEFEGRFFAKINRDFAFDTNIIDSFDAQKTDYAVVDEIDFDHAVAEGAGYTGSYHYADNGRGSSSDGCPSRPEWYRLLGWTGYSQTYGDRMGDERDFGYTPPTRQSNKFGYVFVGRRDGVVDKMTGRILEGALTTPTGTINPGAKIRFANSDPNAAFSDKLSRPYTIIETQSKQSARGGRQKPGYETNCFDKNLGPNWKYAVMIVLDKPITESWMPNANEWNVLETVLPSIQLIRPVYEGGNKVLTSSNPAIFETEPKESIDLDLYYEASNAFPISEYNTEKTLDWFNCYIYGQGVESNRIRDDYNAPFIDKGPKVSTVLDAPYSAERRGSGFIFSQIYNSTSGINRLNQFIQAEPITKDLNPIHGTIQKLHARDTDLISLCEDKCFRILANKDALFNADGNANLTSNQAVLGQAVPYAGEFGISKNPESFASYGFRSYFSDKNRGAVIRLSADGITNIAEKGMSSFFADNLRTTTKAIGSYDDDKDIYNLTLNNLSSYWQKRLSLDADYQLDPDCKDAPDSLVPNTTVSFKEGVDGWTSRKDFIQESGVTLNNNYYTFKNGRVWLHGVNTLHNNFYGVQYDSSFNVVFNEMPQVVKGFSTLNYTGTASRILEYEGLNEKWYSIAEVNANQIIPTHSQIKKHGWYTSFIRTDLEAGKIKEFQKKEGKYFNYIKGTLIGCEPNGGGIGPCLDCGEETPQDYLLTVTIDEACSSSGSPTPDTDFEGWYQWNMKGYFASIVNETLAQDAKCIIDEFYNQLDGDYANSTINSRNFKYVFSEGVSVGTQMYDFYTLEPLTTPGCYLYIKNSNSAAPNGPALDPNNPTIVPITYFIVIWGADGIIDNVMPYGELTTCASPNPDMSRMFNWRLNAGNSDPQIPSFVVTTGHNSTDDFLCSLRGYMNLFWEQKDDPNINGPNEGWSSMDIFWVGPGDIELNTVLYTSSDPSDVAASRYLVTGSGTGVLGSYIEYDVANRWTNVSVLPDGYKLIKTDANGVVTEFTQMNQIPDPPCN